MKVLLLGANGQLGKEFQRCFTRQGLPFAAADRTRCDITLPEDIKASIDAYGPDVIINCAAYNLIDDAEDSPAQAFAINADAVGLLAGICVSRKIKLVHYSSDYVFDGNKHVPYLETDRPNPINVYGQSKLAGEKHVLAVKGSLLFRSSWMIGEGKQNFLYKVHQWARSNDILKISEDEVSVPTFTDAIVRVTLKALEAGLQGVYHLTNTGEASRYELAQAYLDAIGMKDKKVVPVPRASFLLKGKRPAYSVMSNKNVCQTLGVDIPHWKDNLRGSLRGGDLGWK